MCETFRSAQGDGEGALKRKKKKKEKKGGRGCHWKTGDMKKRKTKKRSLSISPSTWGKTKKNGEWRTTKTHETSVTNMNSKTTNS